MTFSVSILEAIVFSGDADLWPRVQSPQLQRGPRPAQEDGGDVVRFLLERSGGQVRLSLERMHRAEGARLALGTFQMRVPVLCQGCGIFLRFSKLSLLDLAILFGQIDCSRLCGPMDIEATEWTLRASLEERPLAWEDKPCEYCGSTSWRIADIRTRFASLPERQAAAAEALRTALQASLRRGRKLCRLRALPACALLGTTEVGADISGGVGVDLRGRSTITTEGPREARGGAGTGPLPESGLS